MADYDQIPAVLKELQKLRSHAGIYVGKLKKCPVIMNLPAVLNQLGDSPSEEQKAGTAFSLVSCVVKDGTEMSRRQQDILRWGLNLDPRYSNMEGRVPANAYTERMDMAYYALDAPTGTSAEVEDHKSTFEKEVDYAFETLAHTLVTLDESPCQGYPSPAGLERKRINEALDGIKRDKLLAQGRENYLMWRSQAPAHSNSLQDYAEELSRGIPVGLNRFWRTNTHDTITEILCLILESGEYTKWARHLDHDLPLVRPSLLLLYLRPVGSLGMNNPLLAEGQLGPSMFMDEAGGHKNFLTEDHLRQHDRQYYIDQALEFLGLIALSLERTDEWWRIDRRQGQPAALAR